MTNSDLTKSERAHAELLAQHLDTVQVFIDENIVGDKAMPAKDIFAGLEKQVQLSKDEFINSLRVNIKIGRIVGIVGKRRWGYCRVNDNAPSEPVPKEIEGLPSAQKLTINIGRKHRIYSVDNHNWALQKRTAANWVSCAYWSHLDQALRGVSRRLLDGEIRTTAVVVKDLQDSAKVVKAAEERVYEILKGIADANVE